MQFCAKVTRSYARKTTVINVILRQNNTRLFQGKLDRKGQIGNEINLVICKENYPKKKFCAKITKELCKED